MYVGVHEREERWAVCAYTGLHMLVSGVVAPKLSRDVVQCS